MPSINPPGVVSAGSVGVPNAGVIARSDFEQLLYRDDLADVFFNADEFAFSVSYYHYALNTWQEYSIIFDNPHASVGVGVNEFNSLRPQFQISEDILLHPIQKNDRCTIRNITYRVDDYISDGVGITTVYLRVK